jgi:hypothetical protein
VKRRRRGLGSQRGKRLGKAQQRISFALVYLSATEARVQICTVRSQGIVYTGRAQRPNPLYRHLHARVEGFR